MQERVCCSVIVTYNRKELLVRNVRKNLSQSVSPFVLIIDNASMDGTEEYLREKKLLDNERVEYVRMDKNLGGAGGFAFGMEYAFSKGFQYVWLMDDDGYPLADDSLQILLEMAKETGRKDVMLNPLVMMDSYRLSFGLNGVNMLYLLHEMSRKQKYSIILDNISAFNGTLISKETYDKIGNIDERLFIWGDEQEYIQRAKSNQIYIATVLESRYFHPSPERKEIFYKGNRYEITFGAYWKHYYQFRNWVYINRLYHFGRSGMKNIFTLAHIIMRYVPEDKGRVRYNIIKGIMDGFWMKLVSH